MRRSDFDFALPSELIAQYPLDRRSDSRLLELGADGGQFHDRRFPEVVDGFGPGDLFVFNDTRVVKARFTGRKPSGGRVELLIERVIEARLCLAQLRASRSPRAGTEIRLDAGPVAEVAGRKDEFYELRLYEGDWWSLMERSGELPLPPYISRAAGPYDEDRYQTVWAKHPGAVAAPTAGLHFDQDLLGRLRDRGIASAWITLHVGAGTFKPIRVDTVAEHRMHTERVAVSAEVCARISEVRRRGKRVVAVGTTCVRALESAWQCSRPASGGSARRLEPFAGETDIFIYPGYEFGVVDALITNFHLPAQPC